MINSEYTKESIFKKSCYLVNVKPTKTQASKFRRGKGVAYLNSVCKENHHVPEQAKHHKEDGTLL